MFLLLAGRIASGKSTLARCLAERLEGRRVGFGDFVRCEAERAGLNAGDRRVLQELGHSRVEAGPRVFVEKFLAKAGPQAGGPLIVEGVRHLSILAELRREARARAVPCVLIFVETDEIERRRRVLDRGLPWSEAVAVEAHRSEHDVIQALRSQADVVVDGSIPAADNVDCIAGRLAAGIPLEDPTDTRTALAARPDTQGARATRSGDPA